MPKLKINKNDIYILAGATGTEIQRRGFRTDLPLWSAKALFEKPTLIKEIYIDYINAGADIITTNTFRTQRRTLDKTGLAKETERINKLAVDVATEARREAGADRPIYIAGCMTTLEDCYRPDLVPADEELRQEHGEQARLLAENDIDFFLLETFNSIKEALAAIDAVTQTGKDFIISFTLDKGGNILSGEKLEDAVHAVEPLKPIAFLVNCVQPEIATLALKKLKDVTHLPFGAYGNGDGTPADGLGWKFYGENKILSYTEYCKEWKDLGANVIGGCCGTSPEYTRSYAILKQQ